MRGVTVPKGAMCTIQIYPLHHNKKFWSDPFKFDPDRWSVFRSSTARWAR